MDLNSELLQRRATLILGKHTMNIYTDLAEWQAARKQIPSTTTIGFVPTMGNLHVGHLSLMQRSVAENDVCVASLFVNPTQFNQQSDFQHYPRTVAEDIEQLKACGVTYCVIPQEQAMYPDDYRYRIEETEQSLLLEGEKRPGHFTGVLTVVMKWLNLTRPTKMYLGQKDFQQVELLKGMVSAFFMDTEIVCCPTIREESRLACSSRNSRLSAEQRRLADKFAQVFHQTASIEETTSILNGMGIQVEYVEERENRRFAAVRIGEVRLIDNFEVARI